jgi:hypothetical protein
MSEKSSRSVRGVQADEVAAAADAVLANGERPTIERVRQALGRGSPNTVGPMLDAWYSTLSQRLLTTEQSEVAAETGVTSNALPAPVARAAGVLWGRALQQAGEAASRAVAMDHEELRQVRQTLEQDRNALHLQQQRLDERADALTAVLVAKDQQIADMGRQLQMLLSAQAVKDEDISMLRATNAGLLKAADVERERAREHNEAHRQERLQLEQRAVAQERRMLEELDRTRQDVKRVATQAADDARKAAKTVGDLQEQLQQAAIESAALSADKLHLEREQASLKDELSAQRAMVERQRAESIQALEKLKLQRAADRSVAGASVPAESAAPKRLGRLASQQGLAAKPALPLRKRFKKPGLPRL